MSTVDKKLKRAKRKPTISNHREKNSYFYFWGYVVTFNLFFLFNVSTSQGPSFYYYIPEQILFEFTSSSGTLNTGSQVKESSPQ